MHANANNLVLGVNGKHVPLFDPTEVDRALQLILMPDQVTELRILEATTSTCRWSHTAAGFFDCPEQLIACLQTVKAAKGVYIVPNPVDQALLARAANRIRKVGKGDSTSDKDVVAYRWFLIDADPQRPTGISSTDEEHIAALERNRALCRHLHERGWAEPIVADSGNGAHSLYRIDLSVEDSSLVERALRALAVRFDDSSVRIDTSVYNPARIWKLYGTLSCKGDSTVERPHRLSRILSAPEIIQVVNRQLLESLADESPVEVAKTANGNDLSHLEAFDIDSFIANYALEVEGPEPYQGGRRWVFRRSPLCEHHDGAAFLIQFRSGALFAGCHHNSCSWRWHDLRTRCEPKKLKQPRVYGLTQNNGKAANPYTLTLDPFESASEYKPFPVGLLPAPVAQFVVEAATAIGCDASYVAMPTLVSLARAIGNSRTIRLKRTWSESTVIWAAIVGKSGTHKPPAMQLALSHLHRKQAAASAWYEEELARFEEAQALYEREYQRWKRSKTADPPPWPPHEPVLRRFIVSDITIEALADRLSGQFDGVLLARDELAGWLDGIAEYKGGKGSDTGHWLASWSSAPLVVDRKTGDKKTIYVPRASVSIVGGIQPLVLRRAIGKEHLHDGLCARLLLVMPDPKPIRWSEATVSPATIAAMDDLYEKLLTLEPAADEGGKPAPYELSLTAEAKKAWVEYYNRHRAEQADLDDDLAAAWSKLEAYTARFALIFQLCSWASGEASADAVDEASIRAAIALSDWFGGEARRVYGIFVETDEQREAREIVQLIDRKGRRITPRELKQSSRRFSNVMEAEAALNALSKAGLGSWEVVSTATKQRRDFVLCNVSTPSTSTDCDESRRIGETVDVDNVDAISSP